MTEKNAASTVDIGLFTPEMLEGLVWGELTHRSQQGYEIGGLPDKFEPARGDADKLWELYNELLRTETRADYPYQEPNDLPSIKALRPDGPRVMDYRLSDVQLRDRMLGALQGRVCGIILGRPVEGASKEKIRARLESTGDYPLSDYFRQFWCEDEKRMINGYPSFKSTREGLRMNKAAEGDDDLNYVMLNLRLLEKFGPGFTTEHVGYNWLESFPVNWAWGPERTAYINLARYTDQGGRWRTIDPDTLWKVTHYLHESSELIGAQIRAEAFGYAAPGLPELAAEWGYRDAALTHVKNGIYGEMLFAAIIAAAFVAPDLRTAVEVGLTEIPKNCRLAEAVRNTLKWWDELKDWEAVYSRIDEHYNKIYTVGGTINNACIIVNALLAGENDFERTLCLTIMQGQDTDCTAGTAGSIVGAYIGAGNVPEKWTAPLCDTFETAIVGEGRNRISEVADRCYYLARTLLKTQRAIPFRWDQ